ncbi:UNVERIFIED_CONTAM: hypothetical protein GTU68_023203 [Idotea baltica]|nr:hypothetical protein [Idotea baltica]
MNKILVANRGEIALRIMRSAKEMGIKTVAVFSEADRNAPHVLYADEAICIGKAPSSASYLLGDKIIDVAKTLNVEGIHPGYGFLSENAKFAEAVTNEGISFIGPLPHAIKVMGSKLDAKKTVKAFDIPMLPGTEKALEDIKVGKEEAKKIGFPVLIKASAGGGGKGMRVVYEAEQFEEQLQLAISEAKNAFGDGSVFIEKYIASPRHIEIQVLGDKHGNYVYLFERECSIQRRHQKVVEEAPSVVLTPELRKRMGEAAVDVARSCDYIGAGTVEFLLDENNDFFFLEMNTRLQVEHPVTEMITGIDLVKEQIKVARGEQLSFTQDDLKMNGHSIELRVYAEDPENNFLPSIGKISTYTIPVGNGIRVDDGLREGMDIPIYYDPMIAKLIVHAPTREQAIDKMRMAINDYKINGVKTTLPFGKWLMDEPNWNSGNIDTHFIKKYFHTDALNFQNKELENIAVELGVLLRRKNKTKQSTSSSNSNSKTNAWKARRNA